jgi:hypothetical protein
MENLLSHEIRMLTVEELRDELNWLDSYFANCELDGHGISSKDSVRRNMVVNELTRRGHVVES